MLGSDFCWIVVSTAGIGETDATRATASATGERVSASNLAVKGMASAWAVFDRASIGWSARTELLSVATSTKNRQISWFDFIDLAFGSSRAEHKTVKSHWRMGFRRTGADCFCAVRTPVPTGAFRMTMVGRIRRISVLGTEWMEIG